MTMAKQIWVLNAKTVYVLHQMTGLMTRTWIRQQRARDEIHKYNYNQ